MKKKNVIRLNKRVKKAKSEKYKTAFPWNNTANNFVEKLQEYGYKGDNEGMCHGVACVAANNLLQNSIEQFDEDLLHIKESDKTTQNQSVSNQVFFSCVEIAHQPDKHPDFIPHEENEKRFPSQHLLTIMPLIQSQQIEAEGGVISAYKFSGAYGKNDLTSCLSVIRDEINKYPHPMVILLSDERHIIAVQYNPNEKTWIFVDANSLPSRHYTSENNLAIAIGRTLTPELKKTVFSATVYVTRKNEVIAKQAISEYTNTTIWKQTHLVNAKNKPYWTRWLFVSAWEGCVKEAALLLAAGANRNAKYSGITAIAEAAQQGNIGVVTLLLKHGALVNGPRKLSETPLYRALFYGHHDIANCLKDYGAKLQEDEATKLETFGLLQ